MNKPIRRLIIDYMINTEGKKVAVIGSRTFTDKAKLFEVLNKNKLKIKLIVSGGARGPDTFATEWANENGVPYLVFPAKWKTDDGKFDRGAGMRRNKDIINYADVVIAFYDGVSKGTGFGIDMAQKLNKPLKVIKFTPTEPKEPKEPQNTLLAKTEITPASQSEPSSPTLESDEAPF